jgi:hypothetical protein
MHAIRPLTTPSGGPSPSRPERSRPAGGGRGPWPELALLLALVAGAAVCGGWVRLTLAVLAVGAGAAAVALGSADLLAAP